MEDGVQLPLLGLEGAPGAAQLAAIEDGAAAVAAEAGAVLLDRFRSRLDISFKDRHETDPVTEVDHIVEELVRGHVAREFPGHAVLGEEGDDSGPDGAEFVWVVDPLDGTANFINGLAAFACSIGVLWRGVPVVGAVFVPTSRHLRAGVYRGSLGGGVRFDGDPFRFQPAEAPASARLSGFPAGTTGVTGPKGRRFGVGRTLGSMAVELVYTAEGTFQLTMFEGAKIWDVAGGVAICLEAGAQVYVRATKGGTWRPLERFAGRDGGIPTTAELRAWSEGLVAGAADVLPELARDLGKEQSVLAVLRRWVLRESG